MRHKDEIWLAIKERIHSEQDRRPAESETPSRRGNRKGAAVRDEELPDGLRQPPRGAIVLTVSFQTAPVQAFLDHVKEWFAPQKTVEQELEGAPETSVDQRMRVPIT